MISVLLLMAINRFQSQNINYLYQILCSTLDANFNADLVSKYTCTNYHIYLSITGFQTFSNEDEKSHNPEKIVIVKLNLARNTLSL